MQKKTHPARPNTSASSNGLGLSRSAHRAVLRASAAVDAGIRVDHKLAITLADRAHRAVAGAHAARDAVIRNLISHTFHLPLFRITPGTHFSTSARELQVFCAILPVQIQIKRDFEFPVFRYESTKSGLSPPFSPPKSVMRQGSAHAGDFSQQKIHVPPCRKNVYAHMAMPGLFPPRLKSPSLPAAPAWYP
mgnify:CR=1 FL=1